VDRAAACESGMMDGPARASGRRKIPKGPRSCDRVARIGARMGKGTRMRGKRVALPPFRRVLLSIDDNSGRTRTAGHGGKGYGQTAEELVPK
jgi:hypothetical protein